MAEGNDRASDKTKKGRLHGKLKWWEGGAGRVEKNWGTLKLATQSEIKNDSKTEPASRGKSVTEKKKMTRKKGGEVPQKLKCRAKKLVTSVQYPQPGGAKQVDLYSALFSSCLEGEGK